ncbi:hypothetical protein [Bradyrhizobium lablabi]|nr:hypothetical protein [Bradyrhizobium lablabi]
MSFIRANDHPNPDDPNDPLYYAPRSARSMANPRSNETPQTGEHQFASAAPVSRFDEMREKAFAKSTRPLESQFIYERRPSRGLLVTAIAAAIGAAVIVTLVVLNMPPRSKNEPADLAVSISTPALATPAQATSKEDSEALLQGFKQFRGTPGSEDPAVSEPAGTAKAAPEKPLLEKFMQWEQGK